MSIIKTVDVYSLIKISVYLSLFISVVLIIFRFISKKPFNRKIKIGLSILVIICIVRLIGAILTSLFSIEMGCSPTHIPISKCHPAALDIIGGGKIDPNLVRSCEVIEFKNYPGIYMVDVDYDTDDSGLSCPGQNLAVLKDRNKVITLGFRRVFEVSQDFWNLAPDAFTRRDWRLIIRENKEINWDLLKNPKGYQLAVVFNNFKNPKDKQNINSPISFSPQQTIINGRLLIDVKTGKNDVSQLKVDTREYSLKDKGKNYCRFILSNSQRETCWNKLGQEYKDYSLCQNITHFKDVKTECIVGIMRATGNPDMCHLVPEGEAYSRTFYKEECNHASAVISGNIGLCQDLGGGNLVRLCVEEVIKKNKDINKCYLLHNETYRSYCLNELAKETNDYQMCSQIPYYRTKYQCFMDMASKNNNPSICNNIPADYLEEINLDEAPSSLRNWCYVVAEQ